MTNPLMTPVEVLRVGGLKPRHDPRQRFTSRLDRQMHMVVQQTVGEKLKRELLPVIRQPLQVPGPIRIVPKHGLSLIPLPGGVVPPTGPPPSPWAGHHTNWSNFQGCPPHPTFPAARRVPPARGGRRLVRNDGYVNGRRSRPRALCPGQ